MSKVSVTFAAKTHPQSESYEYGTEEVSVSLTRDFGDDTNPDQVDAPTPEEMAAVADQLLTEAKIKVYSDLEIDFTITDSGDVVRSTAVQRVAEAFQPGPAQPSAQPAEVTIQAGEDRSNIPAPQGAPAAEPGSWEHLFDNWGEYYDNRKDKRSPNGPDFKHKASGKGMWLRGKYGNAPDWVFQRLGEAA